MKKTFLFLIMAAGLLSCAKEMTPAPEKAPAGVPMSFNITVTGTKAEKSDWAAGDVVYVFFKGLEEKYLSLSYDGSGWTDASGGGTLTDTDFSALTTKTLTAVYLPVAVEVEYSSGTFSFTNDDGDPVYNYYLYQTGKAYTVDGTTVSANLKMSKPEGFAQFHVAGIQSAAETFTLSGSWIKPVACAGVSTNGSILEKSREAGKKLNAAAADADGAVFGGRLVKAGTAADYAFELTGQEGIYDLEISGRVLSAGARYNFPAPTDDVWTFSEPVYDFLHLKYYTFNSQKEDNEIITKRDFTDNDGSIEWWAQVYPSYFNSTFDGDYSDIYARQRDRESNRYACADFDESLINLAELAFNVVDGNDNILSDEDIEKLGLIVEFTYADPDLSSQELPSESRFSSFSSYDDLWVGNTMFYYRTNEKKFIPVVGKIYKMVDGEKVEVPTRFTRSREYQKIDDLAPLEYSSFAVVRWTPFATMEGEGFPMRGIDGNSMYLYTGLSFKDNRPNVVSFYVIKDGQWVIGDADPDATGSSTSNGYVNGISSQFAYYLSDPMYDIEIPEELDGILTVSEEATGPYLHFDLNGETVEPGNYVATVTVFLDNPWQEPLMIEYPVTVQVL